MAAIEETVTHMHGMELRDPYAWMKSRTEPRNATVLAHLDLENQYTEGMEIRVLLVTSCPVLIIYSRYYGPYSAITGQVVPGDEVSSRGAGNGPSSEGGRFLLLVVPVPPPSLPSSDSIM